MISHPLNRRDHAPHQTCLRASDGRVLPAPAARWFAPATPADRRVLERAAGPVLDVGCGPARHALMLAEAGVVTLGIDISMAALAVARRRGAPVLRRSVFARVPGHGRWGTALLLDGNIGIGGAPANLLRRVASLLHSEGHVLVEVAGPGTGAAPRIVRFEHDGTAGPWFAWCDVAVDELAGFVREAGLTAREIWTDGDRRFARLDKS